MFARRKKRDEGEWRREEGDWRRGKEPEQPSTSYTQETKMDVMMNTMEKLMERLTVDNHPPPKDHQEPQNRNQNVRINPPQIKQKHHNISFVLLNLTFNLSYYHINHHNITNYQKLTSKTH